MPSKVYDFGSIEPKWQRYWEKHKTFRSPDPGESGFDPKKPKYYILDMFPYPSGSGLHVGHPEGYTATDIMARHKRMQGFNVLHPMGWDAFGLPTEQYALRTGIHPAKATQQNIATFRRQIESLGFSYDWDREINTSAPVYYRWTQWIFLKLYERGLAYMAEVPVWWCEQMGTVLANEEVIDGFSERGGHPCVRRPLKQWMLKITAYAERLLNDLDLLDWPESIKEMQRNWIGRSEGMSVDFEIAEDAEVKEKLAIFTTRPDTLFGATYMVLAPEHPLVKRITTQEQRKAVEAYCEVAAKKSDLARTDLAKEKAGVFTGAFAWNPVFENRCDPRAKVPIWVADYVLISYGTGAIMAVPAHDERDFDFALKHDIPIIEVVRPEKPIEGPPDRKAAAGLVREAQQNGRTATCFVGDGVAVNSPIFDGQRTPDAKKTISEWLSARKLGQPQVTYRLRDWIFSRQHYWGEPFPLLHIDGEVKPVPESQLPVELPYLEDFHPKGVMRPLEKAEEWLHTKDPETGKQATRETNTMPNWAGSCWYYLRYLDAHNAERAWASETERYWMPVDLYVGGAEHAVLHLLYARFWHKVLYDAGLVSTPEPFQKLFNQGMILGLTFRARDGRIVPYKEIKWEGETPIHPETGEPLQVMSEKMSKARGNVINPDDVVAEYGADTLRLYEMFMGPLEAVKPWNMKDVSGVHRFLHRVWRLVIDENEQIRPTLDSDHVNEALERALHRCIQKVTADVEKMAFNTAISAMMVFTNEATRDPSALSRSQMERFVLILSPFAPHLAEEIWELLGHKQSLAYEPWPTFDPKKVVEEEIELPVQINGKVRARIRAAANAPRDEIQHLVLEDERVKHHLGGKPIRQIIIVPNRLVNIVI